MPLKTDLKSSLENINFKEITFEKDNPNKNQFNFIYFCKIFITS